MTTQEHRDGQSLIMITILIVGMLVFAGLVTDGGYAYAMRRTAQNAADASAFAGAYELAQRKTTSQTGLQADTAVACRINEYAERNGVPDSAGTASDATNTNVRRRYIDSDGNEINTASDIGQVGYIPSNAVGVRVIPNIDVPTFFMGIAGFNQIAVGAEAEAMMGAVNSVGGTGVFPVTVDMDVFQNVDVGDTVRIWDTDRVPVEKRVGAPGGGNTYEWQTCGQRGWLNLNYVYSATDPDSRTISRNHSNNPNDGLRYYVCNDYPYNIYAGSLEGLDGDFINGDPGTRASAIMEAECRLNQIVVIPIYDYTCSSNYLDGQGLPEPEIGWISPPGGQGAGLIYHIVGFAAVRLTAIEAHGAGGFANGDPRKNSKYIDAEFVSYVSTGGIDPGADPSGGPSVWGVALTR
ncbi:MAG: hypothetical protein KKA73_17660 [Chloroflexi bacterium]|nr:hypothetical protein [Chloroflexota bacterium]MBU1749515.1 hypothetical protein [Chloroflexota bacterium]